MPDPTDRDTPEDRSGEPRERPVREGRRRLLRRGLAAAPVLMTLASRPVFGWTTGGGGGNFQCFTPSGFVSMPGSGHLTPTYCSGRTPGYWKTHCPWPSPYVCGNCRGDSDPSLFYKYFSTGSLTPPDGTDWKKVTFLAILSPPYQNTNSGAPWDIARLCVATLLNIAQGIVPMSILTPTVVQEIWNSYITQGYFEPTAGVKWYHDQIVSYLQSTQPI